MIDYPPNQDYAVEPFSIQHSSLTFHHSHLNTTYSGLKTKTDKQTKRTLKKTHKHTGTFAWRQGFILS